METRSLKNIRTQWLKNKEMQSSFQGKAKAEIFWCQNVAKCYTKKFVQYMFPDYKSDMLNCRTIFTNGILFFLYLN